MTHEQIIQRVRKILNEPYGADESLNFSFDGENLDDYIERCIPDAVVLLASKGYRINPVKVELDTAGYLVGYGDDVISFICAECSSWKRPVTHVTEPGTPEYTMLFNEFTKPKENSPVAYRIGDEVHFLPQGEICVSYNKVYNKTEGLWGGEKEAAAICYMTAALVFGIYEDDNGKQRMSDIATNILQ